MPASEREVPDRIAGRMRFSPSTSSKRYFELIVGLVESRSILPHGEEEQRVAGPKSICNQTPTKAANVRSAGPGITVIFRGKKELHVVQQH